jgi:hypothetical protein
VFQHLQQWPVVIRMHLHFQLDMCSWKRVVGNSLGFLLASCCRLWLRPLIHFILIAGLLYIYIKCCSHLQLWPVFIRMQPPWSHAVSVVAVGDSLGFSLASCSCCRLWLRPLIHFILITDLLYTYIKCFGTFNCGSWSWRCNHSLISALGRGGEGVVVVGNSLGFLFASCCRL